MMRVSASVVAAGKGLLVVQASVYFIPAPSHCPSEETLFPGIELTAPPRVSPALAGPTFSEIPVVQRTNPSPLTLS
jgi:hypothetical protein